MSTFTNWDGMMPQGMGNSGLKTKDIIEFIKAYETMLTTLTNHINTTVGTDDPHNVKVYVNSLLKSYTTLDDVQVKLADYAKQTDLPDLTDYVKTGTLTNYVDKAALTDYVTTAKLKSFVESTVFTEAQAAVQNDIKTLQAATAAIDAGKSIAIPVVEATECLRGCVNAVHTLHFTEQFITATIGGSDSEGVFYVLGMLYDGLPGTAYIRYKGEDDKFSATVNWSCTGDKGAMNVLTDADFDKLSFKLVRSEEHVYLAVQAAEWLQAGGSGKFSSLEFTGSGINFSPRGDSHYVEYNGNCTVIAECFSSSKTKGYSASSGINATAILANTIAADTEQTNLLQDTSGNDMVKSEGDTLIIGDESYKQTLFAERPVVLENGTSSPVMTIADVANVTLPVGTIVHWGVYHESTRVMRDKNLEPIINMHGEPNPLQEDNVEALETIYVLDRVPDGWLPLDGSTFSVKTYPELAKQYPAGKLPEADFMIIKADTVSGGSDELTLQSLLDRILELEAKSDAKDAEHDNRLELEASLRRNADREAQARICNTNCAIKEVQKSVVTEQGVRADADQALSDRIDSMSYDRDRLDLIESNLTDERITRANADEDILRKLGQSEQKFCQALQNEQDDRKANDANIIRQLMDESAERANEDTKLHQQIVNLAETAADTIDKTKADLQYNIDMAKSDLQQNIDQTESDLKELLCTEKRERCEADMELKAEIQQVQADADTANLDLANKLDEEIATRAAADADEAAAREAADNAEAAAREAADNAEAEAREVADSDLNTRIDNVKGMVLKRETESKERDQALSDRIDALEPEPDPEEPGDEEEPGEEPEEPGEEPGGDDNGDDSDDNGDDEDGDEEKEEEEEGND